MEYAEALKKVTANKPKENYMVITLSYNSKIVLPYKDGVAFMQTLVNAEQLHEPYQEQHRISELRRDAISTTVMPHAEYVRFKIAALLGVEPEEVKASELMT